MHQGQSQGQQHCPAASHVKREEGCPAWHEQMHIPLAFNPERMQILCGTCSSTHVQHEEGCLVPR